MELPEVDELPDLLRHLHQLVVPHRQDHQVAQVADLGGEVLELVVAIINNGLNFTHKINK